MNVFGTIVYLVAMLAVGMGVMPIIVDNGNSEASAGAHSFGIVRQP